MCFVGEMQLDGQITYLFSKRYQFEEFSEGCKRTGSSKAIITIKEEGNKDFILLISAKRAK